MEPLENVKSSRVSKTTLLLLEIEGAFGIVTQSDEGATKGLPQFTFSHMVKVLELWWQAGSCCQSDILKICITNQIFRGQSRALLGV